MTPIIDGPESFSDREPFGDDLDEVVYAWDWNTHRFVEPKEMMLHRAHRALGVLCLLRGFDAEDIALIAQVAHANDNYADALIDKLEEETGIRFWLSSDQWATIHLDIKGTPE